MPFLKTFPLWPNPWPSCPLRHPQTRPSPSRSPKPRSIFRAAQAENTRRAYVADWRHFTEWCRQAGEGSPPPAPETVVLRLSVLSETGKVSALIRRVSVISQAHQEAGGESPTEHLAVRKVMAGIRRQKGTAQIGKRPAVTEDLPAIH
jgi:hypothetical protein